MVRFLVLFFLLVSFSVADTKKSCPDNLRLEHGVNSCQQVCEEVRKKLGSNYELSSALGAENNLKGPRTGVAYVPTYCGCVFQMKSDDLGLPLAELSCRYRVSFTESGGDVLRLNVDIDLPEDLPTKLVKVMSFQASDPGLSGGAGIVFSGLYATYVKAIKSISAGVALFVLVVVTGFYVFSSLIERYFYLLSDRVRVWSKETGADLARKFAYVTLAVVFFGLPIPTSSPLLKLNQARGGEGDKIAESCTKAFRKLEEGLQEEGQEEKSEKKEQKKYREEASRRCSELKNLVQDGKVYVPLAAGVASGLINAGTGLAKQVSGITESVTIAYMHYKIVSAYKNLEILYENPEDKITKEDIKREAESKSLPKEAISTCLEGGQDVCQAVNSMTPAEKLEKIRENPMCKKVINEAIRACGSDLGVSTSLAKSIKEDERSTPEEIRGEAFNTVMTSMEGIRSGLSWLSPAALPMSLLLFQTALLVPPDKPTPYATVTLVEQESGMGDVKVMGELLWSGITDAVNDASKIIGTVSWGDVIHGNNKVQTAFNLGYVLGFVSMPPGSIFQSKLEKAFSAVGQTASGIFTKLAALPIVRQLVDLLGRTSTAAVSDILATLIAFVIAHGVIDTVPLIAVAVPVIFKFVGFLMDVAKFVISLPFYAALVATKRFEAESLSFFPIAVKFMLTPAVIAVAPLFGFAAIELTLFFLYKLPVLIISNALTGLAIGSVAIAFILGHSVAVLYLAASFAATIVGWETAKGFIDGVFEILQRVLSFISSSASRELANTMTVLRARITMG